MARGLIAVSRGQIWQLRLRQPDHRRPVLVLTRNALIPFVNTVMVASITSTIRGVRSEVLVGIEEGLKHPSAVNLLNVFNVARSDLTSFVGTLPAVRMREVCFALEHAIGCDE